MRSSPAARPLVELHPKQFESWQDQTRHQFILAGRRGGKTVLVRERLLKAVHQAPPFSDVFYIGPTLQDAKDIIWESLEARIEELGWRCRPLISKSRFEFSRNRKIYVIGAEKIRRIRGHKVALAALDEVAFYEKPLKGIWRAVRPALSDLRGRAIFTTTPNGKGTDAYDFYLAIRNRPEWRYIYWTSLDNPWMDPTEIEAAKTELDERSFRQEYQASWESFEGLAYYCFDENLHLVPCKEIEEARPIDLLMDFNVNPTTLIVSQFNGRTIQCKREYSLKNSSTERTVEEFCADHKKYAGSSLIRIFGDAAGSSRSSNTGFSDYHYAKEILSREGFQFQMCVLASNPPIVDRVKHLNSWLKNCYGEARIEVDPSCTDLIRDLSSQELDGRIPSPKNNLGHKADALGYRVYYQQVMSQVKPQGTVFL